MTRKAIILRFVVSTLSAVATMISFGIVYLTNRHPSRLIKLKLIPPSCPTPTDAFRAFIYCCEVCSD